MVEEEIIEPSQAETAELEKELQRKKRERTLADKKRQAGTKEAGSRLKSSGGDLSEEDEGEAPSESDLGEAATEEIKQDYKNHIMDQLAKGDIDEKQAQSVLGAMGIEFAPSVAEKEPVLENAPSVSEASKGIVSKPTDKFASEEAKEDYQNFVMEQLARNKISESQAIGALEKEGITYKPFGRKISEPIKELEKKISQEEEEGVLEKVRKIIKGPEVKKPEEKTAVTETKVKEEVPSLEQVKREAPVKEVKNVPFEQSGVSKPGAKGISAEKMGQIVEETGILKAASAKTQGKPAGISASEMERITRETGVISPEAVVVPKTPLPEVTVAAPKAPETPPPAAKARVIAEKAPEFRIEKLAVAVKIVGDRLSQLEREVRGADQGMLNWLNKTWTGEDAEWQGYLEANPSMKQTIEAEGRATSEVVAYLEAYLEKNKSDELSLALKLIKENAKPKYTRAELDSNKGLEERIRLEAYFIWSDPNHPMNKGRASRENAEENWELAKQYLAVERYIPLAEEVEVEEKPSEPKPAEAEVLEIEKINPEQVKILAEINKNVEAKVFSEYYLKLSSLANLPLTFEFEPNEETQRLFARREDAQKTKRELDTFLLRETDEAKIRAYLKLNMEKNFALIGSNYAELMKATLQEYEKDLANSGKSYKFWSRIDRASIEKEWQFWQDTKAKQEAKTQANIAEKAAEEEEAKRLKEEEEKEKAAQAKKQIFSVQLRKTIKKLPGIARIARAAEKGLAKTAEELEKIDWRKK